MRHLLGIAILVAAIAVATPSRADESQPDSERLEDLARDGVDRVMQMLEDLMDRLPEFRMPEITPEGDIIIRRPRQKPDRPSFSEPEIIET